MDINFQLHCWGKEFSNYSLMRHRDFAGHLATGKNSGTHWVKYMICLALAEHYGVAPPEFFNADATNAFMGNPKNVVPLPGLPRLASSHTIPGFAYDLPLLRGSSPYPPAAVLVRDLRDVLISHYEKWKDHYGVTWSEFLRGRMGKRGFRMDIWWYLHFMNRWGDAIRMLSGEVISVKYEDVRADPAPSILAILNHFGLGISNDIIERAVAASSKDAMEQKIDPDHPERILRKEEARIEDYFWGDDLDFFHTTLRKNLRHDFGYDYGA